MWRCWCHTRRVGSQRVLGRSSSVVSSKLLLGPFAPFHAHNGHYEWHPLGLLYPA
jgi:hypothetical protein